MAVLFTLICSHCHTARSFCWQGWEFYEDGYLVIEDILTEEQCCALRKRYREHVDSFDLNSHPKSVFSTTNQKNDDYFMTSGDKIRFFFEDGVFDDKGNLDREKHLAINKVAHGLHILDPSFRDVTFSTGIQNVFKSIGFEAPKIPQSMYICKQPHVGGCVVPHQDATFLMTEPQPRVVGMWIALEDVTIENSCLWFIPGSHKGPVNRYMIRNPDAETPPTIFTAPPDEYDESKFVAAPVKKGSGILIHGKVVHKSEKNVSDRSRHIYAFHVYDSKDTTWTKDNWLQPTAEHPFPLLYSDAKIFN
eukprot:gene3077-3543_t